MLDRAVLDRDYNVGAAVPEWPQLLARWTADSVAARATIPHVADLAYGSGPRERIDYFGTATGGPVLVFFHGGYWQSRDKSEYSFFAAPYVAQGYDVAIMDYPVVPQVTFAGVVESSRRATAWLARYVRDRRGIATEIVVIGHSAGGHLAAMVAVTDWTPYALPMSPIAGLCSVSGIYDLHPVSQSFVNTALKLSPEDCRAFSPVRHVPAKGMPCLFGVGTGDTPAFGWQQDELLRMWSVHGRLESMLLAGDDHFTILDAIAYPQGAMVGRLLAILASIRDGQAVA